MRGKCRVRGDVSQIARMYTQEGPLLVLPGTPWTRTTMLESCLRTCAIHRAQAHLFWGDAGNGLMFEGVGVLGVSMKQVTSPSTCFLGAVLSGSSALWEQCCWCGTLCFVWTEQGVPQHERFAACRLALECVLDPQRLPSLCGTAVYIPA